MKQEIIRVQNLKCAGCVNSIMQLLGVFPEVSDVNVDLEHADVRITTDADDQRENYEAALTRAGYPPMGEANPLHRQAKSYISCAVGRITKT
jgi:copper chaperone CopZ